MKRRPSLKTASRMFGRVYDRADKVTKEKARRQQELFDALTRDLAKKSLARKTVDVPFDESEAQAFVTQHHPGWRMIAYHDEQGKATIEENPALMKHSYVNPDDGKVYGRTVTQGSPSLDDERLRAEDPDLWERITEWPEPIHSLVWGVAWELGGPDEDECHQFVNEYLDGQVARVLRNQDTFTQEEWEEIQPYMIPGPVSTRLVPPRLAKDEELETA